MDTFYAISEPTRRSIIEMLSKQGRLPAGRIAKNFDMSAPAVSQHLKVLRDSGLVNVTKRAQQRVYELNPGAMIEVELWARQMARSLDELERVLEVEKNRGKET